MCQNHCLLSNGRGRPVSQRGGGSLHPDLNGELFRAVRGVLLCLTALTVDGANPSDARSDGSQLRLLQQEVTGPFQPRVPDVSCLSSLIPSCPQCLSTEVLKLSELMAAVRSEVVPIVSREHPEAERCVRSLQDCLDTVQPTGAPLCCQLSQQLDLPCRHQVRNTPRTRAQQRASWAKVCHF